MRAKDTDAGERVEVPDLRDEEVRQDGHLESARVGRELQGRTLMTPP